MKKLGCIFLLLVMLIFANALSVSAHSDSYNPDGDITVSINLLEDYLVTSDSTGQYTFDLQEDAHILLKDTTGAEVEHSYIWLKINGNRVLGIDPPRPCFN